MYLLAALIVAVIAGIVLGVPPVYRGLQSRWCERAGAATREKYKALNIREPPERGMERDFRQCVTVTFLLLIGGLCLAAYLEERGSSENTVTRIARPVFGGGGQETKLIVSREGEEDLKLELFIGEQTPDATQVDGFFNGIYQKVTSEILAENTSLQEVRSDLNLLTRLDGAELEWEVSDSAVINRRGKLQDDIPMEGKMVVLTLCIEYGGYQKAYEIPITVWGKDILPEAYLESYVNEQIAADCKDEYVALPEEYNGQALIYRTEEDHASGQAMLLTLLAIPLVWFGSGNKLEKNHQRRNEALQRDYPEIVSKLSILLQAGLTVPLAWKRLVTDYEEALAQGAAKRFGYEEMRYTLLCVSSGGYRGGIFEEFGRRCGNYGYMRLGNLLEQHMKTGVTNLCGLMEEEALQAFELRKNNAKKQGEAAGTKLLLPMMLLFGLVLVMVIVPAWSSMSF